MTNPNEPVTVDEELNDGVPVGRDQPADLDDRLLDRLQTQTVPREFAEGVAKAYRPLVDYLADLADPDTRREEDSGE